MKLVGLRIHPLTGARSIDVGRAEFYPGGLRSGKLVDRQFVCYDPKTGARISSKPNQAPRLALIGVDVGSKVLELSLHSDDTPYGEPVDELEIPLVDQSKDHVLAKFIDEFGDATAVYDMGDKAARDVSEFVGKSLRLGQKTPEWLNVDYRQAIRRANSAMHLVTVETIEDVYAELGYGGELPDNVREYLFSQVRANVLLTMGSVPGVEWPKWPEASWTAHPTLGSDLEFGREEKTKLTRHCMRCPVPGQDSMTGEKADFDITQIYRQLPKMPNIKADGTSVPKPILGVYGTPLSTYEVEVGAAVHLR